MNERLLLVGLLCASCNLALAAESLSIRHPLSEEDVQAALALGGDRRADLPVLSFGAGATNWGGPPSDTNRSGHFFEGSQSRGSRTSGFGVELFTPYSWLAKEARDAAIEGREMGMGDVTDELREPVLRVLCHTDVPEDDREGAFGNPVERVYLRPTDKKLQQTAEPFQTTRIPLLVWTPSGETADVGPLLASFELDDVYAMSALDKKEEFYVVIVAADGETRDFKVKTKHFEKLP